MDKPTTNRYKAFKNVKSFLQQYHDILILLNLYGVEEAEYLALFLLLQTAVDKEGEETSQVAASKATIKFDMSEFIYELSLTGSVQAHQLHFHELSLELDKPLGYLADANDIDAHARAINLIGLLDNDDLTEITPQNIIDAKAKAAAFFDIMDKPKLEIETKAAETTDVIIDLMNQLDEPKNRIGKIIHSKQKDLVEIWDRIVTVGKPSGVRHTSIALKIMDEKTSAILRKVKATFTNGTKTIVKYSTKSGWIQVHSLETGNWTVVIEFPTYITEILTNVGVFENKLARFEIKLKKTPPPTPPTPPTE
ncbi:MAG: hypothetical protein WCH34_19075 [Bacteroidota bacterium]